MVVPGSQQVKAQAEAEGLDRIFREAGFDWRAAGCSMCLGMNPDILQPGERCASTSNRNFEGRQGRGGRTHLVSPQMAAAAAVEGHFVDIRELGPVSAPHARRHLAAGRTWPRASCSAAGTSCRCSTSRKTSCGACSQRRGRAVTRFLDLGCGDGALTQLVIDAYPSAEGVLVDFSEPMLKRAGERLRRLGGRATLVRADLNDPSWTQQLPGGRFDAIVSGLAIHHLPGDAQAGAVRRAVRSCSLPAACS